MCCGLAHTQLSSLMLPQLLLLHLTCEMSAPSCYLLCESATCEVHIRTASVHVRYLCEKVVLQEKGGECHRKF
jgi:hypothetical protein